MEHRVKEIVLSNGADVCGIGSIERFKDFPAGFSPLDIWPGCKSVITFGIALPKGLFQVEPRLIYARYNELLKDMLDTTVLKSAKQLEEEFKCVAIPMPSDGPYEYWEKENLLGKGLVSVKHAAVACGLGQMGKSSILLNEKYGSRLNLGYILTDLELKSDEYAKNVCIPGCRKCIEGCPAGAISESGVNQKLCRLNTYGKNDRGFETVDCNNCRSKCPMAMGK